LNIDTESPQPIGDRVASRQHEESINWNLEEIRAYVRPSTNNNQGDIVFPVPTLQEQAFRERLED
jgi:hypothetical protein